MKELRNLMLSATCGLIICGFSLHLLMIANKNDMNEFKSNCKEVVIKEVQITSNRWETKYYITTSKGQGYLLDAYHKAIKTSGIPVKGRKFCI